MGEGVRGWVVWVLGGWVRWIGSHLRLLVEAEPGESHELFLALGEVVFVRHAGWGC